MGILQNSATNDQGDKKIIVTAIVPDELYVVVLKGFNSLDIPQTTLKNKHGLISTVQIISYLSSEELTMMKRVLEIHNDY